jgi:2,3-diketo-5-methylthio-1-phosphopentane phosphatase
LALSEIELEHFAAAQPIDAHFADFVSFCRGAKVPVCIVSDGMNLYIEKILAHNGIHGLKVLSNRLILGADGRGCVQFPHYERGCGSCANCKGYHIRCLRRPGERTVYIGDGQSDLCALAETDILFAKDDLLSYCQEQHIDCQPFETFADVQRICEGMVASAKSTLFEPCKY